MKNNYMRPTQKWARAILPHLLITAIMLLFVTNLRAQQAVQLLSQTTPAPKQLTTATDYYTNYADSDNCDQSTPSNDQENGLGNLHELIIANDFIVNSGQSFTLDSLSFSVMLEPNKTISSIDLRYYKNSGNGPGVKIDSSIAISSFSITSTGTAYDFDVKKVDIDLSTNIEFSGGAGNTVYWIGIKISYDGTSSYLEGTSILNTPNELYYYNSDTSAWIASSAPESEGGYAMAYDGVMAIYGDCTALEACSGQPVAGTITGESAFSICQNSPFSLTVSGTSQASGLTLQWQKRLPEGDNTWTDITGANGITLDVADGISAPTDYRLYVECTNGGASDTTAPVSVTLNPLNECYCIPSYTTACSSGDRISNVSLVGASESINNDSECSENNYGDYTSLTPADLAPGMLYTLSVSSDYSSPSYEDVRAWIDYNSNGIFEDDETIANTAGDGLGDGTKTFDFTVPETTSAGNYNMRVRLVYTEADIDPCAEESYGETEDYTVSIIQLDDCTGVPTAGTVNDEAFAVCAGNAFAISISGASMPANGLARVWQSSPAGANTWTDIENASPNTYTVSEGITEPTDFRYKLTCSFSGETVYSDVISVTLNPATECYCIPINNSGVYYISNVSTDGALVDLNNSSEGAENGYADYTATDTLLVYPGQELDIILDGSSEYGDAAIWFDWNRNGNFEDDGEKMLELTTSPYSGSITIPDTITPTKITRMRVRFISYGDLVSCGDSGSGESEDYMIKVIEMPTCLPPSDIAGTDITASSATISWTANSSETSWEVVYGESGLIPENNDGTSISIDNGTPETVLNNLSSNTSYDVYVRAICSDSDNSYFYGPYTFITNCVPTDVPFTQDFEEVTLPEMPNCATIENLSGGNDWVTENVSLGGTSTNALNYSYSFSDAANAWYFTKGLNLQAGVNYQISYTYSNSSSYYTEKLKVTYGNMPEAASANVVLADHPEIQTNTPITNTIIFTVEEDGVYYFGFNVYSDANQNQLYVDDINIDYGPTCPMPTNITFDYITDHSANVLWTPGANDNSWVVIYGESGFDPTTAGTTIPVTGDPVAIIDELNSETTYDVYVKAICGDSDSSEWAGPFSFTTGIIPPENTALCDAFELMPNAGCSGGPYTNVGAFEEQGEPTGSCLNGFHGTNSVWFYFTATATTATVTTGFSQTDFLTEMVAFEAPTDCSDLTTLGQEIGCANGNSQNMSLEGLTIGEVYYVKVAGFNNAAGNFCIAVQMIQATCETPSNIVFHNIESSSVDVSWTSNGGESQWELIYGVTGFDPASEGTSITVNNTPEVTISNLDPDTSYEVYVRAICASDIQSDWAGPASFTTVLGVENQVFSAFSFYPNPVKNQLFLKAEQQIEQVTIFNLLGQKVINVTPEQSDTRLDLSGLQPAVYLMKVTIDNSTQIFKVVKK